MHKTSKLTIALAAITSLFLLISCASKESACSLKNVNAYIKNQNKEANAICKASLSSDQYIASLQKKGADYMVQGDKIIIALPTDKIFEPGSSEFRTHYTAILNPLTQFIKQYPDYQVNIYGNTDPIASEEFNHHLSTAQAMNVTGYLWTQSVTQEGKRRIKFIGNGELKSISSNTKLAGMAKNRNIMIIIHPKRAERLFPTPKRRTPVYHK